VKTSVYLFQFAEEKAWGKLRENLANRGSFTTGEDKGGESRCQRGNLSEQSNRQLYLLEEEIERGPENVTRIGFEKIAGLRGPLCVDGNSLTASSTRKEIAPAGLKRERDSQYRQIAGDFRELGRAKYTD